MRRPRSGGSCDREEIFDVVVIGFGGAGACAAIEAADRGARVLVIERFEGGGATRQSGGAIYAGGGSPAQRAAGFDDDADEMLRYLREETGGAVSEEVLADFCGESLESLRWLESLGLAFSTDFYPHKTTQPPDGCGLYFSGNEKQRCDAARPAPRGHVPAGTGMTGRVLFDALERAALGRGVEVRIRSRGMGLLGGGPEPVDGVEVLELADRGPVRALHRAAAGLGTVSRSLAPAASRIESMAGRRYRVRARGGVIICAGGFIFNEDMVRREAAPYAGCMPLGTPGDDGSGILLGVSAGGATARMDECAAWRFIYPPEAFVMGVLVNARGERICDESLYGATLCRRISQQPGGRAWLVIDESVARRVRRQLGEEAGLFGYPLRKIVSGDMNALIFRKLNAFLNLHVNRKRASTLEGLAKKCRLPAGALERTLEDYNAVAGRGGRDGFGKPGEYVQPIVEPPFCAVNCDLGNRIFMGPCITLGGLAVDGSSAAVLREDGTAVSGLFAAGRSAVGVCSGGYVSGLSLADCIFSGRRAGRSAAARAAAARRTR
jgi:3-oxo-5alpha-steroid 4-dehydrogenase